jgi:cytochrome P450
MEPVRPTTLIDIRIPETLMTQTDPTDPLQAVTHPNPYPYYAALRKRASLARDEVSRLWIAARARTVNAVLSDERLTVRPVGEPVPRAIAEQPAGKVFGQLARMNEGERHRIARQALVAGLSGVDGDTVFGSARQQAHAFIDRLGPGGATLLDTLAFALPVRIVAEMVGLPAEDSLEATVRQFVACLSPASSAEALQGAHVAALHLQSGLHALTGNEAAVTPLVRRIVEGGLEVGADLPNPLVSNLLGLFSQTFDATAGLIGNSVVTLAQYPDVAHRLHAAPGLIHAFVREVARFDPPVHNTRRFARDHVDIEGATLQPGDTVLVVLAAASRDEAVYEHPDRFILDRAPAPLMGFGAGRHGCPGETVARSIAAGVIAALIASAYDFGHPALRWAYRPSLNGRTPTFTFNENRPS